MSENYSGLLISLREGKEVCFRTAADVIEQLQADLKAARQPSLDFNKGWEKAKAGEPQGELQDDELSGWKVFMYDQLEAELAAAAEERGKIGARLDSERTITELLQADLAEAIEQHVDLKGRYISIQAENKSLRETVDFLKKYDSDVDGLQAENKRLVRNLLIYHRQLERTGQGILLKNIAVEIAEQALKGKEAKCPPENTEE